jgi:GTP pyrophosphokinase
MSESGRPVEIQIRTREMHRIAEYGVAAHWRYKEGVTDKALDQKIAWLRQMLDWQSELKDARDFMDSLKIDLAAEEVFAFTPKGDVFGLTVGATPVDFAYRVHTQVGHRCVGAKVNGKIVPLDSALNNGDIVEIITGKRDAPSLDWLSFVKTTGARVKIKKWLKEQRGGEPEPAAQPVIVKEEPAVRKSLVARPRVKVKSAVKVAGLDNVMVKFSRCCYPIPGEEIIGFVTQGKGISIHKQNCPNAVGKAGAREKMVKVSWNPEAKQIYPVELEVEAFDRVGIFKDILTKIADTGTNVSAAKVTTKRGSSAVLRLVVDVTDVEHLSRLTAEIAKISDVYNVRRK